MSLFDFRNTAYEYNKFLFTLQVFGRPGNNCSYTHLVKTGFFPH